MVENYIIARLEVHGSTFEILVKPREAWDYKSGKSIDIREVLAGDIIYKDARKGLKASEELLQKIFGTRDPYKIAEIILKKGRLQLTTEQRRKMIEEKKRQIINYIARSCIDPRSKLPHPPTRIELAMKEIRVNIDPFKSVEEQAAEIIKELKSVLPLKMMNVIIDLTIPAKYSAKAYGFLQKLGKLHKTMWLNDGSLMARIEVPAGLKVNVVDRLNELTRGEVRINHIEEVSV